jgi:hypothetical protein
MADNLDETRTQRLRFRPFVSLDGAMNLAYLNEFLSRLVSEVNRQRVSEEDVLTAVADTGILRCSEFTGNGTKVVYPLDYKIKDGVTPLVFVDGSKETPNYSYTWAQTDITTIRFMQAPRDGSPISVIGLPG